MPKIVVRPTDNHPTTGYSHGVRIGDTLYVSGQVPRDHRGDVVDPRDPEAQIRQVFANVLSVVRAAGGDGTSIVKVTTFLTDRTHFETWRRIRDEVLAEPYPASTLVVVESLSFPEYLVEIEAIASLKDEI